MGTYNILELNKAITIDLVFTSVWTLTIMATATIYMAASKAILLPIM